jgi:opacity protein-like surface antigen
MTQPGKSPAIDRIKQASNHLPAGFILTPKSLPSLLQKPLNMKRIVFALAALISLAANAQTAEEIVGKYSAALGGLDAFNKVSSAKMTGTLSQASMDMQVTTQVVNNKAFRTDVEVMGYQIINVYNNGTGWKQNHFAGVETPTEITGAELIDAKAQASLVNHLMDYKNRGHKIETAGQEDVEGIKCFRINLLNKDDNKTTNYYISTADYTLIKSITPREMQGQTVDVETFYSNFKEINGLKFAMTRTQKVMGQLFIEIKLDKIELNVPVDEKIFKM